MLLTATRGFPTARRVKPILGRETPQRPSSIRHLPNFTFRFPISDFGLPPFAPTLLLEFISPPLPGVAIVAA
jgi:hypothetical protein